MAQAHIDDNQQFAIRETDFWAWLVARLDAGGNIKVAGGTFFVPYGTSAERPTVASGKVEEFFDTTLGYPIWGNDSQVWKNATGAII